jgi:hypothetical protein
LHLRTKSAAPLSLQPVKSVLVTANESLAILFLVTILVTKVFLVAVVGVLISFVLVWMKVFVPIQILSPGLKTVSIACVQGHVRVSPPGVRIGVFVSTGRPIRIVTLIQSIDVRAYRPVVVAVVVPGLIPVAISMLEVIVLTHVFFVPFVRAFIVSGLEIVLFMSVSIIAALTQPVSIAVLIAVVLGIQGPAVAILSGGHAGDEQDRNENQSDEFQWL